MREPDPLDDANRDGGIADRDERFFYGWLIVGILFFISIIDGGFTYTFSTFLKPLTQEFGWSRAETATAFSLYLLVAGLVLPFWGWHRRIPASRRRARKRSISTPERGLLFH